MFIQSQMLLNMGLNHIPFLFLFLAPASLVTSDSCRCQQGHDCWPTQEDWKSLNETVHGHLSRPASPVAPCLSEDVNMEDCVNSLEQFSKDPVWLQTLPGATESTGKLESIC